MSNHKVNIIMNQELSKVLAPRQPIFAFIWLVFAVVLTSSYNVKTELSHNIYTLLCVISYSFCFKNWLQNGGRLTSLYVFFIAYTMFCNLGQSILYACQVPIELLYMFYRIDVGDVANMLRFQFVCIAALNAGTVLYLSRTGGCVSLLEMQEKYRESSVSYNNKHDKIATVILIVSLLYLLYEGANMLVLRQSMGYHDFFDSGRGETSNEFTRFVKFAALYFSMWAIFRKKYTRLVYGALITLVAIYLLTGARGLSITYVGVLLLMLPISHPNLFSKRYRLGWAVGGVFAFSLLGVIGANRNDLNVSIVSSQESIASNVVMTIAEMGGSARPAVYAIEAADRGTMNYLTIPTTIVRAVVPMSSYLSSIKENNVGLSDFVTDYANNIGSGLGFSCIGEIYVNFGFLGWIFMLFYGYFIAYAENTSYRKIIQGDLLYPLVLLTFLCTMVPWARSEFVRCVNVVRYGLYFVVGKFITSKK